MKKTIVERRAKRNEGAYILVGCGMSPSLLDETSRQLNTKIVDDSKVEY